MLKSSDRNSDKVYVVKVETRGGNPHHPPVTLEPPKLAVAACFRHKDTAIETMREIADLNKALEVKRGMGDTSPSLLNLIRVYDTPQDDSVQVVTMEGFHRRYFVEGIPLI